MARAKSSEQRARTVTRELLIFRGWDVSSVAKNGQLLEESEYKSYPALAHLFDGKSKTGKGIGKPDFLLVRSGASLKPVVVIETKAALNQTQQAIDEAVHYADACDSGGHQVLAVGVAGDDKEVCGVEVKRKISGEWKNLLLNGKPIDWIPSLEQSLRILADPLRVDVEPERPSDAVLAEQANRLNEIFRECKVKDEYRPIYAATFMLGLWLDEVSTSETVVLRQINANAKQALYDANKAKLASSLRVDDQNDALASKAWEIIDILKKLNIRSFLQEHDYLGQLYETFFRYTAGNTIGQYFTPRHIIDFMVALLDIQPNDKVLDPACGTGGFLIGALSAMVNRSGLAYEEAVAKVNANLFGVESEPATAALCVANMILRGDGKSGVIKDDCFKNVTYPGAEVDFVLMNPPFPHKKSDTPATDFIDRGLKVLRNRGMLAAVVPYSLLVRVGDWHKSILKRNTIKAVFTLPPDLFNPYASFNTAVIVIEKGVPHDGKNVFLSRIFNDGYKLKKKARVARDGSQLPDLEEAYRYTKECPEVSVSAKIDESSKEWSPEAYLEPASHADDDFIDGFELHLRKHASFYILHGQNINPRIGEKSAAQPISVDIFDRKSGCALGGATFTTLLIQDYFDVELGGKDEIEDLDEGSVPIVSTSEFMNGVTAYKSPNKTYDGPVITVATDGSVCSSFVQEFEFYAFYKVALLRPKIKDSIPLDALYYIAYLLSRERWRYVYARKFGKARINSTRLVVPASPSGKPDFAAMAALVRATKAFPAIQLYRSSLAL